MGRRCRWDVTMGGNQVARPAAQPRLDGLELLCAAQWKPGFHAATPHSSAQLPDRLPAQAQSLAIELAFRCRQGGRRGVGRSYRTRAGGSRYSSERASSLVECRLEGARCVNRRRATKWKPGFQPLHPTLLRSSGVGRKVASKQHNRVVRIPRLATTGTSDHAVISNRSNDRREASSIKTPEPGALSSTRRKQDGQHS